jgi:hypothetical protein
MSPEHLDRVVKAVLPAGVHVHANADLPGQYNAYHQPNPGWSDWMRAVFGLEVAGAWAGVDGGVTGLPQYERVYFEVTRGLDPLLAGQHDYLDTWKVWNGVRTSVPGTAVVTHTGVNHGQAPTPALVLNRSGPASSAINTVALGDTTPIWKEEPPYTHEWDVRYTWLRAIYRTHFGLVPAIELEGGRGARYVIPDFRIGRNGTVLISLLNADTNPVSVVVSAPGLIQGLAVENLTSGGMVTRSAVGKLEVALEGDDYIWLYAYAGGEGPRGSLLNQSPHKLWFESAPAVVWTGRESEVQVGCDTQGELRLHVHLESFDTRRRVYSRSAAIPVVGKALARAGLMVPDADLGDSGYVSTAAGGRYAWHAWLEDQGRLVSEAFLPVRLARGIRPEALPSVVQPGKVNEATLAWEELPELEWSAVATPLDRARLWDSLRAGEGLYAAILELHSASGLVATAQTTTRRGTDRYTFKVKVPRTASGPFAWVARVQPVVSITSHDLEDSFEGRTLGAMTREIAADPSAPSLFAPWLSYHYPAEGDQQWFDEGIQQVASDGSQSAFLIVTNPAPPMGYSGFGIRRVFERPWSLPANLEHWAQYSFKCDVRLQPFQPCQLELQVRNEDPTGRGHWIQFVRRFEPGADGWHTIGARLDQFRAPHWPRILFDPSRVTELVVNIRMEAPNALYAASFDNIRFDGPESDAVLGADFATYSSADDFASESADTDGDGVPDAYESGTGVYLGMWNTGTDPAIADSDGDGQGEGAELVAGTDPNDASDFLAFNRIERVDQGVVRLRWEARVGRVYQVLFVDQTEWEHAWRVLPGAESLEFANNGPVEVHDDTGSLAGMRYYRLAVLPGH